MPVLQERFLVRPLFLCRIYLQLPGRESVHTSMRFRFGLYGQFSFVKWRGIEGSILAAIFVLQRQGKVRMNPGLGRVLRYGMKEECLCH